MSKTVLAIDIGGDMGWALRHHGIRTSGIKAFRDNRFEGGGMRYIKFVAFLNELKDGLGRIDVVYFEEVNRHRGTAAAHAYGGYLAHLTAWCIQNSIPYSGIPVQTIKKHALGKGSGKGTKKDDMMHAAAEKGWSPANDDEADAMWLLDYVLAEYHSHDTILDI